jgi:amylosucrase
MSRGPDPALSDRLFDLRWARGETDLANALGRLYEGAPTLVERTRALLRRHWDERPDDLRDLDLERDLNPTWFLSEKMVAYVFYADRFCGRLADLPERIPYLKSLGVTYVHIMPCLKPRPGDSDGGYAVVDYREIDPALGTMAEFEAVARQLRAAGISVCLDLVLNHTAKEHDWAVRARQGDPAHQALYRMFDDHTVPAAFERTLPEVFPAQAPGNFTWYDDIGKWVWTTFNEFQWDLNWQNPEVLLRILDIILWLANRGVDVFRLDAVAFMWKRMGTNCQNQPEVHDILQAIAAATRIACPAVIHKAEAIVGAKDLVPYLGAGRHTGRVSNLAYHNNLMVQFWSSLASGDTRLMTHVLGHHFPQTFRRACWGTYIRCHDDIGWAITEEDAERFPPMTGPGHRGFLADFYTGAFPGSWAEGLDFQSNPETGDRRTCGSFASLAGLETALREGDPTAIGHAVDRILLGHALIASFGGVPLLYMGDEIGLTNDLSFRDDATCAADARWLHRPAMDWHRVALAEAGEPPWSWLLAGTRHLMAVRRATPELASHVPTVVLEQPNPALFAIRRPADTRPVTCVFNFTGGYQAVPAEALRLTTTEAHDELISGAPMAFPDGQVVMPPWGRAWIRRMGE